MSRSNTIDWPRIELEYLAGEDSIREIADRHEISDTAIRKKAKAEKWVRAVRAANKREPLRSSPPPPPKPSDGEPREVAQLADDGRQLIGRMLDELDAVTSRRGELEAMIFAATVSEDGDGREASMMRAIDLPRRATTVRALALALKTLNETSAPQGKKAAAAEKASAIGNGPRFAPMRAPAPKSLN